MKTLSNLKIIYIFILLLSLLFLNPNVASCLNTNSGGYLIKTSPKFSKHGLHFQPNGPFAVMLFNEDAIGIYLGIILYKEGSGDIWAADKRFWQESRWADDVTSFAWDPNGIFLYISTSGIYGTGSLYELNLIKKEYKQIFPITEFDLPSKSTFTTEIMNINIEKNYIEFVVEYFDDVRNKTVRDLRKYFIPRE